MRGAGIQTGKPAAERPSGGVHQTNCEHKVSAEKLSHSLHGMGSCSQKNPQQELPCASDSQTKAQELGVLALQ